MALYQIQETPGKEVVSDERLKKAGWDGKKIDNRDKAIILVQALRAQAKKEKKQVDFLVVATRHLEEETGVKSSAGGTSIRLSEPQRRELAKIVGRHMMQTGDQMSMGEAVQWLIDRVQQLEAKVAEADEE